MKFGNLKLFFVIGIFFSQHFIVRSQIITIESGLRKDDGSSSLSKKDSIHLKKFAVENSEVEFEYKNREEIDFELIENGEQFVELCKKHKYTWLFVQASGCGPCSIALKRHIPIADSLSAEDVKIVVVNQDIAVRQLQKKLYGEKYKYHSYILDPKTYGTVESKKQDKFIKELTNNSEIKGYSPNGLPRNFFFNQKAELVYYDTTYNISVDLIKRVVTNEANSK